MNLKLIKSDSAIEQEDIYKIQLKFD